VNSATPSGDLRAYRALRERDLRREGLFIGEGRLVVERMLASDWELLSVLCTPAQAAHFRQLAAGRCAVLVETEEAIASLAGFPFHRGVLAAGRRPGLPTLASFLETPARERSTGEGSNLERGDGGSLLLVLCPRLSNTENLGSIIRSAAAFGAAALAIGRRSCDPLSRQAIKVSAGSVFRLPLVELSDEQAAVNLLHEQGFQLLGTCGDPVAADKAGTGRIVQLPDYRPPARSAVVFGNEAAGLEEPWLSNCDRLLAVPMPGGVDSLNVAVAAGIILWELGASGSLAADKRKEAP
jgi:tRNA G18 (ribose-2'-O)-methylase SpoU